jgi:hypothetical protein
MTTKPSVGAVVLAVMLAYVAAGPAEATYVFTRVTLPDLSNAADIGTIDNNGRIVGTGAMGPFIYDNGNFHFLPPAVGFNPILLGVTNGGIGFGQGPSNAGEVSFVFANGAYSLVSRPGQSSTTFRGGDGGALIFGSASDNSGSIPFSYNPGTGTFTNVGPAHGFAFGGNAAGQIVGDGSSFGWLQQPNGTVTQFQVDGLSTSARGINNLGLITGIVVVSQQSQLVEGFVGSANGFQLISVPGATITVPQSINDFGQIAGQWLNANGQAQGFIGSPATLPVGISQNGAYIFNTAVIPNVPIFIDPLLATGYQYATGAGDPNFSTVVLPIGIGDSLYTIMVNGISFEVAGGQLFDFLAHGFADGVSEFSVTGIETSAQLDPLNVGAFVTELTFVSAGQFTGTQTPLVSESSVPEPASLALFALGVVGLSAAYRRRRI